MGGCMWMPGLFWLWHLRGARMLPGSSLYASSANLLVQAEERRRAEQLHKQERLLAEQQRDVEERLQAQQQAMQRELRRQEEDVSRQQAALDLERWGEAWLPGSLPP